MADRWVWSGAVLRRARLADTPGNRLALCAALASRGPHALPNDPFGAAWGDGLEVAEGIELAALLLRSDRNVVARAGWDDPIAVAVALESDMAVPGIAAHLATWRADESWRDTQMAEQVHGTEAVQVIPVEEAAKL